MEYSARQLWIANTGAQWNQPGIKIFLTSALHRMHREYSFITEGNGGLHFIKPEANEPGNTSA
jgi:hypothetical protein